MMMRLPCIILLLLSSNSNNIISFFNINGSSLLLVYGAEEAGEEQVCSAGGEDPTACTSTTRTTGSSSNDDNDPPSSCRLWLSESTNTPTSLGVYSGIEVSVGEIIASKEIVLPLFNIDDRETSQWQELTWTGEIQSDLMVQNYYAVHALITGLSSTISCITTSTSTTTAQQQQEESSSSGVVENIRPKSDLNEISIDNTGVHRSTHPTAGSFSYRFPFEFVATQNIGIGQELFTDCDDVFPRTTAYYHQSNNNNQQQLQHKKSLQDLQKNGICVDNISVKESTIVGAGHGAFTTKAVKKGQPIVTSPVILFDRSEMKIVSQTLGGDSNMIYSDQVVMQQLLLNYCYGQQNSTILLLPYGPGVPMINHSNKPNAVLQWSNHPLSKDRDEMLFSVGHKSKVLSKTNLKLFVDVVALHDVQPGEEIFIDYGPTWINAWEGHIKAWDPSNFEDSTYQSAEDYKRKHSAAAATTNGDGYGYIRTLDEQVIDPYPDNIRTACMYMESVNVDDDDDDDDEDEDDEDTSPQVYWSIENHGACLRPCDVVYRQILGGKTYYNVKVYDMVNKVHEDHCSLTPNKYAILGIPEEMITIVDREYTADTFWPGVFRHEIGIPNNMYPKAWTTEPANFAKSRAEIFNSMFESSSTSSSSQETTTTATSAGSDNNKESHYRNIPLRDEDNRLEWLHEYDAIRRFPGDFIIKEETRMAAKKYSLK